MSTHAVYFHMPLFSLLFFPRPPSYTISDTGTSPPVILSKNFWSALNSITWKCSMECTLLRLAQFLNHITYLNVSIFSKCSLAHKFLFHLCSVTIAAFESTHILLPALYSEGLLDIIVDLLPLLIRQIPRIGIFF